MNEEEKNAIDAALTEPADAVAAAETEEVKAEEPKTEEPKAEETKPEEPKSEEPKAEEPKPEETKAEGLDLPTEDEVNEAKEELGIGGAAYVDELLTEVPDAFARLRAAGKTLGGLFNFAYSLALKEYLDAHGRKDGGGWWSTKEALEKYLDPVIKEGFTYGEPKTRKPSPKPAPAPAAPASKPKKAKKKPEADKVAEPKMDSIVDAPPPVCSFKRRNPFL